METTFLTALVLLLNSAWSLSVHHQLRPRTLPDFRGQQNHEGVDYFRCVQNGTIAITFDDGPDPSRTPQVLAALRVLNVPATFFVVGNMEGRQIYDPASQSTLLDTVTESVGHSIGHHSWSHSWPGLDSVDEATVVQEIRRLHNALTLILNGDTPSIMRPPYGAYDDEVVRIVNGQFGYKLILWSIDTDDWEHPGDTEAGLAKYEVILEGTNPALTPGFIALHHDPLEGGAELAIAAINYGRDKGYRFVSLQECLNLEF